MKRKTIGLLISGIADNFSCRVCRGVIKTAQKNNVDVLVFPGKYLDRDLSMRKEIMYEYQYNTLFQYARKCGVDGIIVAAGSICCYTNNKRMEEFLEQYEGIPTVIVGGKLDGYISVNYDNYKGIEDGVEYLIHKLGCQKITMVGGPDENTDAFERKQTFFQVMKKNNISGENTGYIESNLCKTPTQTLVDYINNNTDVEAFFCVNDDTALGVCDVLKKVGRTPGKDVYVMGYDNTIQAEKANPSLTSVEADPGMLGVKAVEMLAELFGGKEMESAILPTKFIKRDSFGSLWNKRELEISSFLVRDNIDKQFDNIFYRYIGRQEEKRMRLLFHAVMDLFIECCERKTSTENDVQTLVTMIDGLLLSGALEYVDMQQLLNLIEGIYQNCLMNMEQSDPLIVKAGVVYQKLLIGEEQLQGERIIGNQQKDFDLKTFVISTMQFDRGNDSNYSILVEHLGWLDVKNAYVCVYEKPIAHLYQEKFELPENFFVKASLENGKVRKRSGLVKSVSITEFFGSVQNKKNCVAQVVLPIFANEMLYGIALCDMTEKIYDNGEFLAGQLGAASKMLHLLKINEDIQAQYEESLRILQENNVKLDVLAKSDALTGILNRRGFMEACEEKLLVNKLGKIDALVLYIDMNNLKIINDRYGHEEGDFSIKAIASILTKNFPNEIIGRLGGDEFALLYSGNVLPDRKEFISRIYRCFDEFNAASEKEYNVTVSAGACPVYADMDIDLQDALAIADEKLYVDKQNRVKNVVKS